MLNKLTLVNFFYCKKTIIMLKWNSNKAIIMLFQLKIVLLWVRSKKNEVTKERKLKNET